MRPRKKRSSLIIPSAVLMACLAVFFRFGAGGSVPETDRTADVPEEVHREDVRSPARTMPDTDAIWRGLTSEMIDRGTGMMMTRNVESAFLLETLGVHMEILLERGDREGFMEAVSIHDERFFDAETGLSSWKLERSGDSFARQLSSASVDDLRMCRVLMEGYELWGDESLLERVRAISKGLLRWSVRDGILVSGASWEDNVVFVSETLPLCYADIRTMNMLGGIDPEWFSVASATAEVLRGIPEKMALGSDVPWGLDVPGREYLYRDDGSGDFSLMHVLTLLHNMVDAGMPIPPAVFEKYGKMDIEALFGPEYDNVAVLSLASMLLKKGGMQEEAIRVLSYVSYYWNEDLSLLGYRLEDGGVEVWAFDNLMAIKSASMVTGK